MDTGYQLLLLHKTERVCIFKLPPLSTSKGYYFDDWKEMIWEGGVKLFDRNKVLHVTFVDKNNNVFASSRLPKNTDEAIIKTQDSSRGYAVRLEKPSGNGYFWVGVAFRDRNDAFDFGVGIKDFVEKNSLNSKKLDEEFANTMDFSVKKGEKIKINVGANQSNKLKPAKQNDFDLFNFTGPSTTPSAPVAGTTNPPAKKQNNATDWGDFNFGVAPTAKPAASTSSNNNNWFMNQPPAPTVSDPKKKQEVNLLDL